MHFFGKSQEEQQGLIEECLSYQRKLVWVKVGDWMDKAKPGDKFPFKLSSNEQRIIEAVIIATKQKREAFMKDALVVIEQDRPDFRWSDLIGYPDVQASVKEITGFKEETWVDSVLPILLRLRPTSVVIRSMQSIEHNKKTLLNGLVDIGLKTIESSIQTQRENYKKRRSEKYKYPEEKIRQAISMYQQWESLTGARPLKKAIISDIKLIFSEETTKQPSSKQIGRWAKKTSGHN